MSIMILRRPGAAAAPASVQLVEQTLQDAVTDPSDAYCAIIFRTTGKVDLQADSGSHPDWMSQGVAANYSIRLDTGSGTLSVGSAGQDLPMTSDREFGVSRTTVGSKSWVGTITIKRASDSAVVAGPVDISLTALVSGSGGGGGGSGSPVGGGSGNFGINLP